MHVSKLGGVFKRCPKSWLLTEARWCGDAIRDWGWLDKRGKTAVSGGVLEQPPRWLEMMELIDGEVDRHRERLRKAQENG